ncbi:uncharacterized protein LOC110886331 isoform X2 [Helianthus annuus]|uniref:uncharacterized protein LOC110886331 isoform X2 n=1 Tax=Helianthus annuus TaxID=4232 RepID=UPI001653130D|nr:uncharacterized protein LOC110886331 isoform X2 [Helianthus annuus]
MRARERKRGFGINRPLISILVSGIGESGDADEVQLVVVLSYKFTGGTRSICVFADEMGSSSISPLIVTGGKGGDVGVHDFRYIATRRPKKHKNSDNDEQKFSASSTAGLHNKHRDQNGNGMLWYIPKAHSGSVTRISAILNTSFFLTGSKDRDVNTPSFNLALEDLEELLGSKMKEAKKLVEASVRVKCSGMVVFGLNALEQLYI